MGPKKIGVPKNFGFKKILGLKKFLGPNSNFESRKNFGSKKILVAKKCATNRFLVCSLLVGFGGVRVVLLVTWVLQTYNPLNPAKSP